MSSETTAQTSRRGHEVFSKTVLAFYDWWVLGITNHLIWQCPTREILEHYNRHVSSNHLEVGVGTGYYPDRGRFRSAPVRLALMDLNPNCLEVAASRLKRYRPVCYRQDILKPITVRADAFDSIAINYVFHCLPEPLPSALSVLERLEPYLKTGGTFFGATLLGAAAGAGFGARKVMAFYNKCGIFSNTADHFEALEAYLARRYKSYSVRQSGCVALFSARK